MPVTLPKELVHIVCSYLGYHQSQAVARCCRYLASCVGDYPLERFFRDSYYPQTIEQSLLKQRIDFSYHNLVLFHEDLQPLIDEAQQRLLQVTDDIVQSINNGKLLSRGEAILRPVNNFLGESDEELRLEFVPLIFPLVTNKNLNWLPRLAIKVDRDTNHSESLVLLESFYIYNQQAWWMINSEKVNNLPLNEISYSFTNVTELVKWMKELPSRGYMLVPYESVKEYQRFERRVKRIIKKHPFFFLSTDWSSDWIDWEQ